MATEKARRIFDTVAFGKGFVMGLKIGALIGFLCGKIAVHCESLTEGATELQSIRARQGGAV